ncbi:hypothetical protein NBH00_12205 [Paraconexibacter antarcticus]|uniref:EfeO-type cupredoxin-like domain-containing protein n=1 Tax=Paraconexibacter antarcticus TaxID=2949664 RepID=A0ABY5DZ23_9ACTN|nr:hypothetical protein [Paraconexibacter antarcticus]UTI66941.1 hypothetical protein NBH00_12205 [Paraconexibacter antarcticus]
MSQRQRIAVIAVAVAVLVVGFVIANGSKNDNKGSSSVASVTATTTSAASGTTTAATTSTAAAPAPATPVITITGGKPAGGIKKLTFAKGDDVRFTVASDVADEIHVHGYDFHKDVAKGGRVSFDFPAKIDGIFEIELENAGVQIAELKVTP